MDIITHTPTSTADRNREWVRGLI